MKKALRLIALLAFLLAVALAWYLDLVTFLSLESFREYARLLGPWAPLVFCFAFVFGELLQVPSVIWVVLAGLIWPLWLALPLSLFGAMLAATVAFLFARFMLGRGISSKLPRPLRKFSQGLEQHPIKGTALIRLTTFLHPLVHWLLAASKISLSSFLIGSLIGITPAIILLVVIGDVFVIWWDEHSLVIIVAAITILGIYGYYVKRQSARLLKPDSG